uniref:phosphatidylserine decarboxylase n=1 Tax=Albugo laibachii Nc14 TaxID=890382 RepID=F0WS98_9STRA|nr:unnamed protein product [Albugo laibachii Nc14]CCA26939.1 unnamed protein product [Albugo laibachii Nc14]|eukprot:CCA26939.1 unnamed protein product [Albugo laibachii Nc14]
MFGHATVEEKRVLTKRQVELIKMLPYRAISRLWGQVHDKELYPLDHYRNLGQFFSRPLKPGARLIVSDENHLASPVDAVVATFGRVSVTKGNHMLEQIKGVRCRMDEFLGTRDLNINPDAPLLSKISNTRLYHCVLYLAPGDYHRIHGSEDWTIFERRHFPGNLFSVNSVAARLIPGLFVENERVALLGSWKYGFFSMTAVGATNVGSIALCMEPDFKTNSKAHDEDFSRNIAQIRQYERPIRALRGQERALFKLGSTVVLIFEAPENFEFCVQEGQKVRLGSSIGHSTKPAN